MKQLLWLGVLSLLAACSKERVPIAESPAESSAAPAPVSAESAEPASVESPPADQIDLLSLFGAQIELAAGLPANELRGDFTGDGIEDRAYLVKSSSFPPNLAPDVQILRPFQKPAAKGPDVKQGSAVSLVLVNGGPNFPSATIVVHDPAVDGRLATASRLGIRLLEQAEIAATPLSASAKGAAVVLPRQAGSEDILYWDGAGYELATVAGSAPSAQDR
jgi:hypothetical protein